MFESGMWDSRAFLSAKPLILQVRNPRRSHKLISACAQVRREPLVPLPKLYDAWFEPNNQLAAQMHAAVSAAAADGITDMELKWMVVPNLEEIAAGTKLNMEFGFQVARDLGMEDPRDYQLIKRYLASFCNLYWAKQVAAAPPFAEKTLWAVATDSISKVRAEASLRNVKVASLRSPPNPSPGDAILVIDPRITETWLYGAKLKPSSSSPLIMMNSEFNETYGLTGPRRGPLKNMETVYYLKRVTRGYVFRAYPGPWQAYLEKPDTSVELLATYEKEPKLRDIAKVVREESNNRFGAMNDRYAKGFGGRL